jgi:hypothetical protein
VRGHLAYWAHAARRPANAGYLVWQYARGGWALLSWNDPESPGFAWQRQAKRIADNVRYGAHATSPLTFAAQLFAVPSSWQVSAVQYRPVGAVLLASQYTVTKGPAVLIPGGPLPSGTPIVGVLPATARGSCQFFPQSVRKVVGGYPTIVTDFRHSRLLCARHADGLWVEMSVHEKVPTLNLASLFAHHLNLLGLHPGHWFPEPIARLVRLGP